MRFLANGRASGPRFYAIAASVALGVLVIGCQSEPRATGPIVSSPRPLTNPAGPGSQFPSLSVDEQGRVLMSWLETRANGGHALRWSMYHSDRWLPARTIAEGDSFFVNWADFPTLISIGEDRLAAHWPWMSGAGTFSYDVRLAISTDGGGTWIQPITPHQDATQTEHGFVSLIASDGNVQAVWLDGRDYANQENGEDHHDSEQSGAEMSLRSAVISPDGELTSQTLIDERICDCCQTSAVQTSAGTLVAYRDRDSTEIRDISLALYDGDAWQKPHHSTNDGWEIQGCPVNGAALDAVYDDVAMVWYTEANGDPRVQITISTDGGRIFGPAYRIDSERPLGRVDVLYLGGDTALVMWLEQGEETGLIRLQTFRKDGSSTAPFTLARTSPARASGFPRMIQSGDQILFAWTETSDSPHILMAAARVQR